jgi:bacterioferritin
MGTKGLEIVNLNVEKLLELLNKALADEWLAYYQYWIGAKVAQGPMRNAVTAELEQHATEELGHALLLVERILQLGGSPILEPKEWYSMTNCGYDVPADSDVRKLLEQNISGEQCAIGVYKSLADFTKDGDPVTYNLAIQIMSDEIEHEEDLQALQEDIVVMVKKAV